MVCNFCCCFFSSSAPDIQDLKISVAAFTNTSINLTWFPPKFINGVVRYYYVHYILDDVLAPQQQQDLIDSMDEQQSINEQRRVTVHDTKVSIPCMIALFVHTIFSGAL